MSCDPFEWTCARFGKTYSNPFFMSYPREFWKDNKKPCPFCGSDDVVFGAGLEDGYYVECCDCSAKVEACSGLADAIAGWNRRAINRDELLKVADECERADVDGVTDWAERIRKAVG